MNSKITNNKLKVFVGMSGGVDSSVAALLLKLEGYDVTGVYMKNWSGDEYGLQDDCPWEEELADAKAVCELLEIPFMSFNFEKEYREKVVENFFDEYKKGRTPNPDVLCNKEIKFDMFLNKALEMGADKIATGHYAQVRKGSSGTSTFELHKAVDKNKDQTYFLYALNQDQLSKSLFPIGHLEKSQVRQIAREHNLPNAAKKDSQGICFIGEIDVRAFLRKVIKEKKGSIVDIDTGKNLGEHDGIMFYTIGQRHGLDLGGAEKPYFVCAKDEKTNTIYAAQGHENKALYASSLKLENLHLIKPDQAIWDIKSLTASIRYRSTPIKCQIDKENIVAFENPVWAVAPGQSCVFYDGEKVLGGGVIA